MKKSRFTETQVVSILKQADAGVPVKDICRQAGISVPTYYKWKSKYGGLERTEQGAVHVPFEAVEIHLALADAARERHRHAFGGPGAGTGQ